jgi:hypothetical protein
MGCSTCCLISWKSLPSALIFSIFSVWDTISLSYDWFSLAVLPACRPHLVSKIPNAKIWLTLARHDPSASVRCDRLISCGRFDRWMISPQMIREMHERTHLFTTPTLIFKFLAAMLETRFSRGWLVKKNRLEISPGLSQEGDQHSVRCAR